MFSPVLYRCCRVDHYAVFGDPAILCCHDVVPLNDAAIGKHISRKIVNCISFLKVDKIKTVERFRLLIHAQYNKQHHRKVLFSSFHSNWSHFRISSTDSKVRTILYSKINNTTEKVLLSSFHLNVSSTD